MRAFCSDHCRIGLGPPRLPAGQVQAVQESTGIAAYALAEENLRLGRTVIADCVNPLQVTRAAWVDVADRAGASVVEVEIMCSDTQQHRQRVENRVSDIFGLKLPSWDEVISREYEPWLREHIVIDTAQSSVGDNVKELLRLLL